MNIGVVGLGVVGGAVYKFFMGNNIERVFGYDVLANKTIDSMQDTLTSDVLFLCLPSETKHVGGKNVQDLNALIAVLKYLSEMHYAGVVCIKTTTLPGVCKQLQESFDNLKITHNPEFLTAAKLYDDFCNQPEVMISGEHAHVVAEAYKPYFELVYTVPSTTTTELAKYMHNCFLATKVMFCNEFYHLCVACGEDYNAVKFLTEGQGGLGKGHTKVPGPDGRFGYSGQSFPKDTLVLQQFMADNNIYREIIDAVCETNIGRNMEYLKGSK